MLRSVRAVSKPIALSSRAAVRVRDAATTSGRSDRPSRIEDIFAHLDETEHAAHSRLDEGCAADSAQLARFFAQPLAAAKSEATQAILSMGKPLDVDLARALRLEAFEEIGARCVTRICTNVSMRFRARFKLYAQEFLTFETYIVERLLLKTRLRAKRIFPRIFRVGYLNLDDLSLPACPSDDSAAEVAAWIERLRRCIHSALLIEIDAARRNVLKSGMKRIAVVRTHLRLALRDPRIWRNMK